MQTINGGMPGEKQARMRGERGVTELPKHGIYHKL